MISNILKATTATATAAAMTLVLAASIFAAAPGAQTFEVYDDTNLGLDTTVSPDIGNVNVVANPGGQARLIIQAHLQKVAPNCTYRVELVRGTSASNGGLDAIGHTGVPTNLGTLTTNKVGNGNAHFDVDLSTLGDGTTPTYGHLDFEAVGTCTEADGSFVVTNEYGAAPDPALTTPLTWLE